MSAKNTKTTWAKDISTYDPIEIVPSYIIEFADSIGQRLLALEDEVHEKGEKATFESFQTELEKAYKIFKHLPEKEKQLTLDYFNFKYRSVMNESECAHYMHSKPRGYAGDFVMMEMIWKGRTQPEKYRYRGTTNRGKILNAFNLDSPNCVANVERVHILKNFLSENKDKKIIASIGCGSVIELDEFFKENNPNDYEIHLFDQDEGALECASKRLQQRHVVHKIYKGNILKSILKLNPDSFDMIYSSGLFDYFPIAHCQKIANKLWPAIKKNGVLCVINANPNNPSKMWMEVGAEWQLDYKHLSEFLSMGHNLPDVEKIVLDKDSLGIYQYYKLYK
jgi:ubiquinone/menaquinone biosynthesis C-methylase UbiE